MKLDDDLLSAKDQSFRLVCENEYSICVHDFAPVCYGHCVILPKRRVKTLSELTLEESKSFFELLEKASDLISKTTGLSVIIFKNTGKFITYDEQVHFHLIPSKYKFGEMYNTTLSSTEVVKRKRELWSKEQLQEACSKIKQHM